MLFFVRYASHWRVLCGRVSCSLVVTCWERTGLFAFVFVLFVTFPIVSWSTSEVRAILAPRKWFKPSSKNFYRPFQGGTSIVDHLCYLCLVFVILSRLFITALLSPAGKGLTSWYMFVMFIVFLLLFHVLSWVRCGT